MSDLTSALLAAAGANGPGVRVLQATFVSADANDGCLIDVQGSRIPAALATAFLPEVGEVVWVWVMDDRFFIMGPAAIKPDSGTVESVSGGLVTLMSNLNTEVTSPYEGGTPPSAGQVMKLLWHGGPFAMLSSTSPTPNTPPPAAAPAATSHTDYFTASDTGSFGSRWWTNEVWASDSNLGAWFYGSKISDTIPAGAVISSIQIYISPRQISGSAPNFGLHPYRAKPGVSPSFSNINAIGVRPGWVTLPNTYAFGLIAGGGSAGIGVAHGGYNIFNSLATDGQSGKLCIVSTY